MDHLRSKGYLYRGFSRIKNINTFLHPAALLNPQWRRKTQKRRSSGRLVSMAFRARFVSMFVEV